jgi:hypothetical protein
MIPTAPAPSAFDTYRLPSVSAPFIATNTAPRRTLRESYSTPVIAPSAPPPALRCDTSAISSFQFILCLILLRGYHAARPRRFSTVPQASQPAVAWTSQPALKTQSN